MNSRVIREISRSLLTTEKPNQNIDLSHDKANTRKKQQNTQTTALTSIFQI